MKKTFVLLASSKCVEDATSEHYNKKGEASNIIIVLATTIAIAKK